MESLEVPPKTPAVLLGPSPKLSRMLELVIPKTAAPNQSNKIATNGLVRVTFRQLNLLTDLISIVG